MWDAHELARVVGDQRGRSAQELADGLLKRAVPDRAGGLRDDIAILALRAAAES